MSCSQSHEVRGRDSEGETGRGRPAEGEAAAAQQDLLAVTEVSEVVEDRDDKEVDAHEVDHEPARGATLNTPPLRHVCELCELCEGLVWAHL